MRTAVVRPQLVFLLSTAGLLALLFGREVRLLALPLGLALIGPHGR